MGRIILGLATPHSPQVSTKPEEWYLHRERDIANRALNYAKRAAEAPAWLDAELTPERFQQKYDACQHAITTLAKQLADAAPDTVIVIGDDQEELFLEDCIPAIAIFTGEEVIDTAPPRNALEHPSIAAAYWARHADLPESYPIDAPLARHLAAALTSDGFDLAQLVKQHPGRPLGHAFTFVRRRLMDLGRPPIPMIPIMLNTFYPPNQPTPHRCYAFGQALRRAIASFAPDRRVAIVASGGLSHFIVDEALDRRVLRGLTEHRPELLTSIPLEQLESGSSEIRNWIAVAGACFDCEVDVAAYIPAYRSPARTGCGMGFAAWHIPLPSKTSLRKELTCSPLAKTTP
jgi:3-O-methylgallate 3,4-dioxygenase